MKKNVLLFLLFTLLSVSLFAQKKVKNVIFLIGDGMGLSQVYATQTEKGELCMLQFPYTGLVSTFSANNYITDSAAAGTALSSGVKTNNGVLGLDPEGNKTVSIMELAKAKGLKTGIAVTCTVTHATPGEYYAHQKNREMHEEIANDLLSSGIDVCIGGGKQFFEKRKDGRNLSKELQKKGYQVVYTEQDFLKLADGKVVALLADEHLPKISEGRGNMLPETTGKMLSMLNKNNKQGFFVMIEGSQIDWGGHANDQEYIVNETYDFDQVVKKAVEFAKEDGNTLVIVTADHETGGMTLTGGNAEAKEVQSNFSTKNHTATPVPVYAFGPGAEYFTGYFDNTEFISKIQTLLGL